MGVGVEGMVCRENNPQVPFSLHTSACTNHNHDHKASNAFNRKTSNSEQTVERKETSHAYHKSFLLLFLLHSTHQSPPPHLFLLPTTLFLLLALYLRNALRSARVCAWYPLLIGATEREDPQV